MAEVDTVVTEGSLVSLISSTEMTNETTTEDPILSIPIIKSNLDKFFLIIMGIVVFLMQCGFAFLEAGSVRSKNTVNILIKNMLDLLIGGISYWAFGWAIAYGETGNGFIGTSQFFSYQMEHPKYPFWFFQFVFAATAATIVSGSIAERCCFSAYFVYSIIITGWVYPPVSHWAWDPHGWLNQLDYADFAGSGVVHVLGGTCALVGCWFIGPRLGRFDAEGRPPQMPGHSVPLAGLGGFILLFGFLAFNGGSQLTISNEGDAEAVGLAIVNTILGGSAGGIVALILSYIEQKKWSYLVTLNGALTGMVSQCAGCNVYEPWAGLVIGMMAGCVYFGVSKTMVKCGLDDPLDAVAVHFGGGILGVLCVPFFKYSTGIFWIVKNLNDPNFDFESKDYKDPGRILGVNIAGLLAIITWSAFWSTFVFGGLQYFNNLRVDSETETKGNDMAKHGEAAYPQEAWLEDQYRRHSSLPPMMRETKMDFPPNLTPNNDIDNRTGTANGAYVQTNEQV